MKTTIIRETSSIPTSEKKLLLYFTQTKKKLYFIAQTFSIALTVLQSLTFDYKHSLKKHYINGVIFEWK